VHNFHEGDDDFLLLPDGTLPPYHGGDPKLIWDISDSHHFVLGFETYAPQGYTFVGDFDRYLRRLALAGEYADDKGQSYRFNEDGSGVFPNQRFRYTVASDHTNEDFDSYYIPKNKADAEFIGFKRNGDQLEIYRVLGEFPEERLDDTPLLLLRKRHKQ